MNARGNNVVVICGSRKPAPGIDRPSAVRELLKPVLAGISQAGAVPLGFDLRDMDVPQFDGRTGEEYGSPDLERLLEALSVSSTVVFSVPAYWRAPSGPLVNLLNVLGGAAYDRDPGLLPPFEGKTAVQLVVGADPASGYIGASVCRGMLSALGFTVSPRETVVGDPRAIRNVRALTAELVALGTHAAQGGSVIDEPLASGAAHG